MGDLEKFAEHMRKHPPKPREITLTEIGIRISEAENYLIEALRGRGETRKVTAIVLDAVGDWLGSDPDHMSLAHFVLSYLEMPGPHGSLS